MDNTSEIIEELLKALYDKNILDNPNFKDTPKRVAKMFGELLSGEVNTQEKAKEILCKVSFPTTYQGIIMSPNHRSFSMCPHHLAPVEYRITLAYFPDKIVTGASKLARLINLLSSRAVLQETLTEDITWYMTKYLKPKGVAVFVKGVHACMRCRGVKTTAPFMTQKLSGIFVDNPAIRNELSLMLQRSDK